MRGETKSPIKKFFSDFLGTIVRPSETFGRLAKDPAPAGLGLRAVLCVASLYFAVSLGLAVAGAVPLVPAVLPIGPENYYVEQAVFIFPLFLLMWGLAAGIFLVLGKKERTVAAMRTVLGMAGFALAPPLLLACIPSAVGTGFMLAGMAQEEWAEILSRPGFWQTFYVGLQAAAAVWSCALLALAALAATGSRAWRAALAGFLAAAAVVGLYALCIR